MTSLCLPRPAHQPHALLIGGLCACSLLHVDTFLPDMHVACFCPLFTEFTVWIWISKRHLPQSPLSKRSNLTPPAPTRIPDNKLHTYLLTSQLSQWNLSFMRTGPLVTHVQVHFPQFLETCPQKKIQSALGRINEWKRTVNEDGRKLSHWASWPSSGNHLIYPTAKLQHAPFQKTTQWINTFGILSKVTFLAFSYMHLM